MLSHLADTVVIHQILKLARGTHGRFFKDFFCAVVKIFLWYLQKEYPESYNLQMSTDFSQRGATERPISLHVKFQVLILIIFKFIKEMLAVI